MEKLKRSQTFLRKRRLMLVLPIMVIPFLTLGFAVLGGGKDQEVGTKPQMQGLNLNLPDANLKDDGMADKLSFYDKAAKDSAKRGEYMRTDPYYNLRQDTIGATTSELENRANHTAAKYNQRLNSSPYESSHNDAEEKLLQKLSLLQQELNKPTDKEGSEKGEEQRTSQGDDFSEQIDRLEGLVHGMATGKTDDPEMQQLGHTLNKILDIQHPQRVKDRLKEKSAQAKGIVFRVNKTPNEKSISLLGVKSEKDHALGRFYSLDRYDDTADDNAIEAVIHANQTLIEGAVVKFRLLTDVFINGKLVPNGTLVNGIATQNGERLNVEISGMRSGNSLYSVKLWVYDLDGLPGIYIPGAISRDVAKQTSDNALQLLELSTMDPSLKAQAAAAGINVAKSFIGKKVKQVKVAVKAGYKVLFKNQSNQE